MFDEGFIKKATGTAANDEDEQLEFIVNNVQIRGGYILHIGSLTGNKDDVQNNRLKVGDTVELNVDMVRRKSVMNNHTGTHVLNFALRQVLGEVDQRGSLVAPDRLRFDFTAKAAMKVDEVKRTEHICQKAINDKWEVYAKETPLSIAKTIQGLRAVFDETYPDPVRVVSVGKKIEDLIADPNGSGAYDHSVEFCGGTHLKNSSHMDTFIILSEEAIAKGVRRIIAVTGAEAQKASRKSDMLEKIVKDLKTKVQHEIDKKKSGINLQALNKEIYNLNESIVQSQISYWRKDSFRVQLEMMKKSLLELEKVNRAVLVAKAQKECKEFVDKNPEAKIVVKYFEIGSDAKQLNEILQNLKQNLPEASFMLFSIDDINNKILCITSVPDSKKAMLRANEWLNTVLDLMAAKGGGKDTSAQATGSNINNLQKCIDLAQKFAETKLN
jgi:alanyl-tRNA synthetase